MKWEVNKLILLVNFVLIVMVGSLLYLNLSRSVPRGHGPREGFMRHGLGADITRELGLSNEQAQKLESHKASFRAKNEGAMRMLMAKRIAVASELSKPEVDLEKVKAMHQEFKNAMSLVEDERLQDIISAREILGAEKFKLFTEKIGKRMAHGPMGMPPPDMPMGLRDEK